jgi:hypothetical protein
MKEQKVKVKDPKQKTRIEKFPARVYKLLRGTAVTEESPVKLPVPPLAIRENESSWETLLTSTKEMDRVKRRGLAQHIRALLKLHEYAREQNLDLAEAARQLISEHRATVEKRWVAILEEARSLEIRIRWAASILHGMQEHTEALQGRIHWLPMSTAEAVTPAGNKALRKYLAHFMNRPDCRAGRGYVACGGWAGDPDKLDLLNRTTHKYRALLWTDGPRYQTEEQLWADAQQQGTLELLPGTAEHKRHCVMFGNWVRVRPRFVGRFAEEESHVFIPGSGSQFGQQMGLLVQGRTCEPAAGWEHPLSTGDATEIDLLLDHDGEGHDLFAQHRLNPIILSAPGSARCVNWGAFTLGEAQIGEAIVEMETARYIEWVLNKCCMYQDLDEGKEKAQKMLSAFVTLNSGPGRMFRSETSAQVLIDGKTLVVIMSVAYRTVAEKAVIRMTKKHRKSDLPADISVERAA